MGLGIGSKPDPLTARNRIRNPIKVILHKTPCDILLIAFEFFYLHIKPISVTFSIRAISGASGLRFGRFWIRCDRGKESYLPVASL